MVLCLQLLAITCLGLHYCCRLLQGGNTAICLPQGLGNLHHKIHELSYDIVSTCHLIHCRAAYNILCYLHVCFWCRQSENIHVKYFLQYLDPLTYMWVLAKHSTELWDCMLIFLWTSIVLIPLQCTRINCGLKLDFRPRCFHPPSAWRCPQ